MKEKIKPIRSEKFKKFRVVHVEQQKIKAKKNKEVKIP